MTAFVQRIDLTDTDPDELEEHIVLMCRQMQRPPAEAKLAGAVEVQGQLLMIFQNDQVD